MGNLDEALKLLNGLDSDPYKRSNIIKYVQAKNTISAFAYGSLIWNPIEHVKKIIPDCSLIGFTKGFLCQDAIYRGTTDCKALTMGLKPCENSFVKGCLLTCDMDQSVSFVEALVKRETPVDATGTKMNIYIYDFLPVMMLDGEICEWALVCVVNCSSQFYVPWTLSIEQQAKIIGQAYGVNGTNFQYLRNTINIFRQLNLVDTFTHEMEQLYAAVLEYRQCLAQHDLQWLIMFDQLTTHNERRLAIESRKRN